MTGIIRLIKWDDARELEFLGEIRSKVYCEYQMWGRVVDAEDEDKKAVKIILKV